MANRLLLPVSRDTIPRSIRHTMAPTACQPRVIGIDNWAWRRGERYGTLICDLARRQVIDLRPDREPATVEAWLKVRPQIEVVARDRNGGYAGSVSRALPEASKQLFSGFPTDCDCDSKLGTDGEDWAWRESLR